MGGHRSQGQRGQQRLQKQILGLFSNQSQRQGEVGKYVEKESFLAYNLDKKRDLVIPGNTVPTTMYTQQKGRAGLSFKEEVVIRQGQRQA